MVKKSEKLNRIYALGTLERIAYEVGLSQKDTCRFVDIALSLYKDTGTALWLNAGISIGIELAFWIRNNEEYVRLYKKRPEYLKHLIKVDGGITNARKRFVNQILQQRGGRSDLREYAESLAKTLNRDGTIKKGNFR
jgi:hypothetical protein